MLLLAGSACFGSPFDGKKWITDAKEAGEPNRWLCFRKEFVCDARPREARLSVAVDSKYWLWVNGRLVVFEGALKRGPNPNDTYYDEVDLSAWLKKGKNTLAIQVWYWGKQGFCHNSSGKAGLIATLSLGNRTITTDESWKVKLHPAYGKTEAPHPNYRLPESNVRFDARADMPDWFRPGYDDSGWASAAIAGNYPCAPWNRLVERPFPNWYDTGVIPYLSTKKSATQTGTILTCKLPKNITVTPWLKVKARAGQLIDMRTDNYKGGSEYNVRSEYITRDGVQEFEALNYFNGHNVLYTLPEGVEVLSVGYRETRFNTRHTGDFACSDTFYNVLWHKALNTMNLNMRDAIQDPDRERSQWWGDAVIIMGEIFYSCDPNGQKAVAKAIRNLVDWQKRDSVLFSPIPAGRWDKELPVQMLASVGKLGFWNYFRYTGDTAMIRHVYPAVKKYMSLWKTDSRGLVVHRKGGWDWSDWGKNIDVAMLDNAWYSLALDGVANMAQLMGEPDYARVCRQQMVQIRDAVNREYWNGKEYRSTEHKGKTDDRANGLAVLAGFADEGKYSTLLPFLQSYKAASPYMEKYILESFFVNNQAEAGLERMKERYTEMVASPLTSLWEDWEIGGSGGGSINHGWAGGPLTLLSQYVAGVSPQANGWDTILVKPQTAKLEWVKCTVPVKDKAITVEIRNAKGEYCISVNNQTGRPVVVAVPRSKITTALKVCGKTVKAGRESDVKQSGCRYERADSLYYYFGVSRRKLSFVCR